MTVESDAISLASWAHGVGVMEVEASFAKDGEASNAKAPSEVMRWWVSFIWVFIMSWSLM